MASVKGVPHVDVDVEVGEDAESNYHVYKAVCKKLLPGWRELAVDDIQVSKVTGGISNALFKLTHETLAQPRTVVFRVNGVNTDYIIDRQVEMAIMEAVQPSGFGPKILGTFPTGRIEEFLPLRCLEPAEMGEDGWVPRIAACLSEFHRQKLQGKCQDDTPFGRISKWINMAESFSFEDPKKKALFEKVDLNEWRREVAKVEKACAKTNSPKVLCHCDLLSGNVMVEPNASASAAKVSFIDFEYADKAPRGFDWGNHFNEYAGFEGDYTRYPEGEAARRFLRAYLDAEHAAEAKKEASSDSANGLSVSEEELDRAVAEANVFALASHLYWGVWSLIQARYSAIEFDYLEYSTVRWNEYLRRRDEFLGEAERVFGK
ncbi:choline/ethanolamine kinase [Helicosporidium sp. ATCC 50920]|nr:choline/ethanolamine kinase [Helicosporidium sp. ATCC 50920]|eukprot:KDD75780.1 choline/ethanolamine kinase [Helicosporidium sp. ATCC 50920]